MTTTARLRTKEIGNELIRLIKLNSQDLNARVIQFGDVMFIAHAEPLSQYLPGIFVRPETASFERDPMDISGTQLRVLEVFRISYAYSTKDVAIDTVSKGIEDISTLIGSFNDDAHLSNIASDLGLDQIEEAFPLDVDWEPEEDIYLRAEGVPVKVVTARWQVNWLARRSS